MSTRPLQVIGTLHGDWRQWIGEILSPLPCAIERAALPYSSIDSLPADHPESRTLVLVEHPTRGLAGALESGEVVDPEAWLDDWVSDARTLLSYAHRAGDTALVVNADEVLQRPHRLARLLRTRWGVRFTPPLRASKVRQADLLSQALAWSFVDQDPATRDLASELMACCAVLPGTAPGNTGLLQENPVDATLACHRLSELLQVEHRLSLAERDHAAEREALRQEVNTASASCAQAVARLLALESERDDHAARATELEKALARASQHGRELEQQLRRSNEERREFEEALDGAQKMAHSAREEYSLLLKQLHQTQEELERAFIARREAEAALSSAAGSPDSPVPHEELRRVREECELLTLQTTQIQRELERVHAEKMRLAQEVRCQGGPTGFDDISIGEITVVGERDTPPHREITFMVHDVRAGDRRLAHTTVRLVEHWGRPGLAVFAEEGQAPLFDTWREFGREDGRPFMLLVHGEESAQGVYDAMGTLDWQLAQSLADRLDRELRNRADELTSSWQPLSQRLLTSLREQPSRLRYDNVTVGPLESSEGAHHFRLTLERVSYFGRTWRRLPLAWVLGGPDSSLALGCDDKDGPPLLAWPTDDHGAPVAALLLPLRHDSAAAEVRAAWDRLTGSDRGFVSELLNLMPILAVHLQAATASDMDLQAMAAEAMLFGRKALQPPPPALPQRRGRRRLLNRVMRRLGAAAGSAPAEHPKAVAAVER